MRHRPDSASSRSLGAVIDAAVIGTGAASGWILRNLGTEFVVVAAGGDAPDDAVGTTRLQQGSAGYAAISGQPTSIRPAKQDAANAGAGGAVGVPASVLAIPCGESARVVAVLELANAAAGAFNFEDIEVTMLLAEVVVACLPDEDERAAAGVPSPARLASQLETLARIAPDRYHAIARTVETLLE